VASLTYACFIPAKGLIRNLSANLSNIAFEVPLAFRGGNLALYHYIISIRSCQFPVNYQENLFYNKLNRFLFIVAVGYVIIFYFIFLRRELREIIAYND